jgi:hypothetical protein
MARTLGSYVYGAEIGGVGRRARGRNKENTVSGKSWLFNSNANDAVPYLNTTSALMILKMKKWNARNAGR